MSRLGLCLVFTGLVQLATTQTPNVCVFGGVSYGEGAAVGGCVGLRCLGGQWMPTGAIDSECSRCDVFWDPHFITFDGYYYRLQIPCRFTLAQPGTSQQPEFGVFAQFVECNNPGTCVGATALLDSNTMVEVGRDGLHLGNITRLYVNDELFTLDGGEAQAVSDNILTWWDGDCVRLTGTSGLTVEACPYHVVVWAHPDTQDLNGLCGQYNLDMTDDLMGRTGHQFPLSSWSVMSFGFSWMTSSQTSDHCAMASKSQSNQMPDECTLGDFDVSRLAARCDDVIASVALDNTTLDVAHRDMLREACAFDLCLLSQASGRDNATMEAWLAGTVTPRVTRDILEQRRTLVCESDGVSYQQGDTISVNCALLICDEGLWIPTHTVDPQCCEASGILHQSGHTISVDCLTHHCVDGDWQASTQPHPSCCEFDGSLYGDGEVLPDQCFVLRCSQGSWTDTWQINAACRSCGVYWDPHFQTFDYGYYMYHSQCNYSLTQPDTSLVPSYGVFARFDTCMGEGTCVEHITFKNGPNTVLEIDSLDNTRSTITVNGDDYVVPVNEITQIVGSSGTHPVLAWRTWDNEDAGKRIVGSNGLSVEVWSNSVNIYAFHNAVELHGLCGNNNDNANDEYTSRYGNELPTMDWAIRFFALTWQTVDQTSPACAGPLPQRILRQAQALQDPCVVDDTIRAQNFEQCQATMASILDGNDLISQEKAQAFARACEFDLCMVYMNSSGDATAIAAYLRDTIAPVVSHDLELANSTVVIDSETTTAPGTNISFPPGFNQIIIQVNQVCNCNEENIEG